MSAIDKLKGEMEQNKNNTYIQFIGEYLINLASFDSSAAVVLSSTEKTIAGSLEAMRKIAEQNKVGNMAVIAPDHGLKIICEYFGLKKNTAEQVAVMTTPTAAHLEVKPKSDLNFDDLFEV
jgi:hypothetical protein